VQPGEQLLLLSTAVTVVVQALLNQLLCTAHVGFACMHACVPVDMFCHHIGLALHAALPGFCGI
jgi:hypothetical protein